MWKNLLSFLFLSLAVLLTHTASVRASTMHTLYSFCSVPTFCQDGTNPSGPLLSDDSGGFYATVYGNTANGAGGVVHFVKVSGAWEADVIYSFCANARCLEGGYPDSGVIKDAAGNLYGVTSGGSKAGTVFELMPNASHTKWTLRLLHRFCTSANCTDGRGPTGLTYVGQSSGVPYDGISPLYGTADGGGINEGGVAFSLMPNGARWRFKKLHDFGEPNVAGDGSFPRRMIADPAGNLFAATEDGGAKQWGAVVELKRNRSGKFKEKVIYNFCSQGCADGIFPSRAALTLDANGNLFGTTAEAGANNSGTIFKLSPGKKQYSLTTLYSFCSQFECSDGFVPAAELTLDSNGNIIGTTAEGGDSQFSAGVVFTMNPGYHVLYTFCVGTPGCPDGQTSETRIFLDGQNNLFGMTHDGGAHGVGVLFEISP